MDLINPEVMEGEERPEASEDLQLLTSSLLHTLERFKPDLKTETGSSLHGNH